MKIIYLFLFIQISTFAVDSGGSESSNESSVFEYTRRISETIDSIDQIKLEDFSSRIEEISATLEKYFEYKKGVCRGEFSTIIFKESEDSKTNYKLTKKEQLLCFRELKALQVKYINKIFKIRKAYLDFMHEKRISELKKVREGALDEVQRAFQTSRGSNKRKRRR